MKATSIFRSAHGIDVRVSVSVDWIGRTCDLRRWVSRSRVFYRTDRSRGRGSIHQPSHRFPDRERAQAVLRRVIAGAAA
jgi:hypothetical protein